MDAQGFTVSGLHAPRPHAPAKANVRLQHAPEVNRAVEAREAAVDARIHTARRVKSVADVPFTLMFAGFALSPVAWVAGKLKLARTATVLKAPGALMESLRSTSIADAFQAPAQAVKHLAHAAEQAGGKAAENWAPAIQSRGGALAESVLTHQGAARDFFKPVSTAFTRVSESGRIGSALTSAIARMGRWPLLAGTTLIGAGAATVAIWSERGKTNRAAQRAFAVLEKDLGATHPLTVTARRDLSKQQSRSIISAGMETASEALFVGLEAQAANAAMAGLGGFGMMGAQMGLMGVSQLIVPENALLNSVALLKQEADGKAKLSPGDRVTAILQLFGTMPQAATKGGTYNRLAHAEAATLVRENASYETIIDTLKDPAKFEALAARVSSKMAVEANTAKAGVAAPAPATPATAVANDGPHAPLKPPTVNANDNHQGPVPATKVSMAAAANDGRVVERGKQVG